MSIQISGHGLVSNAENTEIVAYSMNTKANQHASATFRPHQTRWVGPRDKDSECVIDSDRTKEREHVGTDVMRVFDVSHGARMKIQPFLAKNCVPAPTDQKIHNDQDPNGEMINLRIHSSFGIIFPLGLQLQVDSSNGQSFSSVGQLSVRVIGIGSGCSAQVTSRLQGEGEGEARTPDEEA